MLSWITSADSRARAIWRFDKLKRVEQSPPLISNLERDINKSLNQQRQRWIKLVCAERPRCVGSTILSRKGDAVAPSGQIDRKSLQVNQRAVVECAHFRRPQHHARRGTCDERLFPPRGTQAPLVPGLETGETIGGHWRAQIIAA